MTGHKLSLALAVASIVFAAAAAACLVLDDYLLYVVTIGAIFASLAVAFDVLLGFTGYLSLAHGALYGLGAYTCALLTARYGLPFWAALPLCGIVAGAAGALIALVAFRTKGLYFAVLTLGIGLIGHQLFLVLSPWTGASAASWAFPDRSSRHGWRCAAPAILRCWPSSCCWSPSYAPSFSCARVSGQSAWRSARISPWPRRWACASPGRA
jgi:ABC-type branched-subunit amino acid transport system permease subunit